MTMDLRDLNPEQRAAVEHNTGPLLVVAGAGTGKTEVITRRVAYLIASGRAKPAEILVLTFTEKAAREMAERIYDLVGWQAFQIPVMTFHGFGAELLGRYASHIGRSIRGGLINDTQKALLLKQQFDKINLSYYPMQGNLYEFLAGVVVYIGHLQNADVAAEAYVAYAKSLQHDASNMHAHDVAEQADLAALYELYQTVKAKTGTFDYSDQLLLPLHILRQRPNLAERLRQQYRYVLVDEYQDTNTVQDELIRSFIPPDGNIFAVGDDDQAIYGFRGSEIANILAFAEHFRIARPVVLVRNYRSGQAILDSAYRLIRHNDPERLESRLGLDKRLVAVKALAGEATLVPYATPADELEGVADALQLRLKDQDISSVAVLAATKAPLKALARLLQQRNVPFTLTADSSIFEQPELISLWYLLQWLDYRASDESIAHVALGPFMSWSADAYRRLLARSHADLVGVEESLRQLAADDAIARTMIDNLDQWRNWARELPVSRLAFKLVFETGLSERLIKAAEHNPRMVRVFDDLQRLLSQMQDYEIVSTSPMLAGYLSAFPEPPTIETTESLGQSEGVQLLSVHASKGLEFELVYLIGCTQRSWSEGQNRGGRQIPEELRRKLDLPPEHEFRRLMYVAVTRAKQKLVVSTTLHDGGGRRHTVSPLLAELFDSPIQLTPSPISQSNKPVSLIKLQRSYPLSEIKPTRFPFEAVDGWLELGVNDLGLYERCPYDFYIQNVLGISQPFGPQLGFGLAIHGTIQAYYEANLRGEVGSLQILHQRLDELWSDRGYERREMADSAQKLAHDVLERFIDREQSRDRRVLASELPIRLELPEAKLRLRGRIDASFEIPAGVELRDFKTGRKTDPEKLEEEAKKNFQLRTYALAYQDMTGQAPAVVTLDYVVTGIEGVAELSPAILINHRVKLAKLAHAIRQHVFTPKPSLFHHCAAIRYYGSAEADAIEVSDA